MQLIPSSPPNPLNYPLFEELVGSFNQQSSPSVIRYTQPSPSPLNYSRSTPVREVTITSGKVKTSEEPTLADLITQAALVQSNKSKTPKNKKSKE